MAAIGILLIVVSVLAFWGGVIWLIVSLIRQRSVRRSLGLILSGVVVAPIGFVFMAADFANFVSEEPTVVSEPLGADADVKPESITVADMGTQPVNPYPAGRSMTHDGIEVTVLEVRRDYPKDVMFFAPKEGHEWVTVTLRLRNTSDSSGSTKHYNAWHFRITGDKGVIYGHDVTPSTGAMLNSGEFFGGSEVTGDIVHQVQTDDTGLVLIYSAPLRGSRYLALEEAK